MAIPTWRAPMYIVAIGWLSVTILIAVTERSVTAGLLTLLLYGVAPLALFWWIVGAPKRRARPAHSGSMRPAQPPGKPTDHAGQDQ